MGNYEVDDVSANMPFLEGIALPRLSEEDRERLEGPITDEELGRAFRAMARGKAPEVDGLPAEIYKEMEEVNTQIKSGIGGGQA